MVTVIHLVSFCAWWLRRNGRKSLSFYNSFLLMITLSEFLNTV